MQATKDQIDPVRVLQSGSTAQNNTRHDPDISPYTLHIQQQIELGMEDSRDGRITSHTEMKKRFRNGAG